MLIVKTQRENFYAILYNVVFDPLSFTTGNKSYTADKLHCNNVHYIPVMLL